MSILEVAGARLYYEVRGTGPTLVLVPGAKGTADTYQPLARELSSRFRVVTYDRRGFSRSTLHGPPDDDLRLAADTDDLRSLITHLAGDPAGVFGNSSGAIVALRLLTEHPELVGTVVAHEPPTVNLLPDAATWLELFDDVYATYRRTGIPAAMRTFATGTFSDTDRRAMHRQTMRHADDEHREANTVFWLEHELRTYPRTDLDLDALAARAGQLPAPRAGTSGAAAAVAAGGESRGYPTYRTSQVLADRLGLGLVELPGGHIACVTEPAAFADALAATLTQPIIGGR